MTKSMKIHHQCVLSQQLVFETDRINAFDGVSVRYLAKIGAEFLFRNANFDLPVGFRSGVSAGDFC